MYFDGGAYIGREPKYGLENSADNFVKKMDMRGIRRSLFCHFEAVYYDMYSGNERTLAIAKQFPDRLVPMAVINPYHFDYSSDYLDRLKKEGFKCLGFFSHSQYWKMDQFLFRHISVMIDKVNLPVQIGVASLQELNLAVETFKDVKTLVLIRWVRGGGYNALADEIAIGKEYKNFYFDVGNLVSVDAIKLLSEKIGSNRLYVCGNSPLVYDACPYLLVESNQLNQKDRENIIGNTIANVLEIKTNLSENIDDVNMVDFFSADIKRPKIDTHWHLHGWDIIEPGKKNEAMKRMFDECGYEKVVCSSILSLNFDLEEGNRQLAKFMEDDGRVFGYIVVDPTRVGESLVEIEKYVDNKRFIGLKTIQDYYNIGINDERYVGILKMAEKKSLPILCHRGGIVEAAKKFPNLIFISAHTTLERIKEMPKVLSLPNVMFDISGSYAHKGETNLSAIIKMVGSKRVLFSSDGPLISPYWTLGKIVETPINDEEKDNIYFNNALDIFPALR